MLQLTPTGLSLYQWATILGIDAWELSQFTTGFPAEVNSYACDHPFFQYPYQADLLSREEIAGAIKLAEQMLATELGFWTYPYYTVEERVNYPRPANRQQWGVGNRTPRGQSKAFQLQNGKLLGGGIMARTLIAADVPIQRTDEDSDGVNEILSNVNPVPTSVTNAAEIAYYYSVSDRVGIDKTLSESWRIRPLLSTISGGNLNFRGFAGLALNPLKTAGVLPSELSVTDAANYVDTIDIYRVYRDDRYSDDYPNQGYARWETGCDNPPCEEAVAPICIGNRNGEEGIAYVTNTGSTCWYYDPDYLTVNYLSGVALENGLVPTQYAQMVAYLAVCLLPHAMCGCERSKKIIEYWRRDITIPDDQGQVIILSEDEAANPFGNTRRGTIWAYRQAQELKRQWVISL